jgi:hypothetical protein
MFKYIEIVVIIFFCSALLGPGRFFSFLIIYIASRTPWMGDQPIARPLPIHKINTQTSMPRVGFEPTTPAFEWAKIVHALELAATVISKYIVVFV